MGVCCEFKHRSLQSNLQSTVVRYCMPSRLRTLSSTFSGLHTNDIETWMTWVETASRSFKRARLNRQTHKNQSFLALIYQTWGVMNLWKENRCVEKYIHTAEFPLKWCAFSQTVCGWLFFYLFYNALSSAFCVNKPNIFFNSFFFRLESLPVILEWLLPTGHRLEHSSSNC